MTEGEPVAGALSDEEEYTVTEAPLESGGDSELTAEAPSAGTAEEPDVESGSGGGEGGG